MAKVKKKNKNGKNKRKVMIIGAGGIGSFLIPLLDKTDLYNITVYDPDVVETKNITYQNFDEEDVEKHKVKVMQERYPSIKAEPYKVLTAKQVKGYDLVICCADNLAVRRTLYASSGINWLDLRAQGRNAALISSLERPELYSSFTAGPDGSFSCQGDSWEGDSSGVHFMQVVAAGYGAQWIQRWFNNEDVKKHATYNG
jgi:molybdopterin/thiamine biosynthesis adenylyltransferase